MKNTRYIIVKTTKRLHSCSTERGPNLLPYGFESEIVERYIETTTIIPRLAFSTLKEACAFIEDTSHLDRMAARGPGALLPRYHVEIDEAGDE